jgi:hypothetical protein
MCTRLHLSPIVDLWLELEYLTPDYYDRDKVAGFGKFRHIFLGFYYYQP